MAELSAEDVFGGDVFLDKLVVELDATFPIRLHTPTDDLSKIMFQNGQRSVVEYIKAKQLSQEN